MSVEFNISGVAFHLVDPSLDGPKLSEKEIVLTNSGIARDIGVLKKFFDDHLEKIWVDKEKSKKLVRLNLKMRPTYTSIIMQCVRIHLNFFRVLARWLNNFMIVPQTLHHLAF